MNFDEVDKFEPTFVAIDQNPEEPVISSMRVNLVWHGFEIRSQQVTWCRKKSGILVARPKDILKLEAQDFKITVHMSSYDQRLSVIVLLKDLRITDLLVENDKYFYRDMVKVASQDKNQIPLEHQDSIDPIQSHDKFLS